MTGTRHTIDFCLMQMRIHIIAVGKIRERYIGDGVEDFIFRLRPYLNVTVTEIPEERTKESKNVAIYHICQKEGERIRNAIIPGAYVWALDPAGKVYSSTSFAERIEKCEIDGPHTIVFIIGGSYGLSPEIKKQADELLSLSPMTFPHQIARFILLEQLYRAFRIIRGEPYHK